MSNTDQRNSTVTVEARGSVRASADRVYGLIADYRNGHRRIVPPKYFQNLAVESGGFGEGTVITFEMKVFGRIKHARARITEPEPGQTLVETVDDENIVTTFRVDKNGSSTSTVTISSDLPTRTGLAGAIERVLVRSYLEKVYDAELALLDRVASSADISPSLSGARVSTPPVPVR